MKKPEKTTVKVITMNCGGQQGGCSVQPYILPYCIKKAA
jgi:hypothetical protein